MDKTCLVIPAAGAAVRWGLRTHKELLPVARGSEMYRSLLQHALAAGSMGGADTAVVITKYDKIQMQVGNIESWPKLSRELEIYYTLQPEHAKEIWGAITCSFAFTSDRYFFAMPDTFFPEQIFMSVPPAADFWLGIFATTQATRFGILDAEDWIFDKGPVSQHHTTYAWGVASWSLRVVEFWQECGPYDDYAAAFNHAILHFGCEKTVMDFYYDNANYDEYKNLLRGAA